MRLGLVEKERYRDISWLMPSVDVPSVLARMGISIASVTEKEVRAFCPDHILYVGQPSSDPNWTVNRKTGKTFCFTEDRGSNLFWVVSRLLELNAADTVKFLTGLDSELSETSLDAIRKMHRRKKLLPSIYGEQGQGKNGPTGLSDIKRDMESRNISSRVYSFFMNPPGKPYPTNIRKQTVDKYKVFERTWGKYTDRAIIPFQMKGELVGFCAIDLLGKEEWIKAHPLQDAKDYKKTLYPYGFKMSECLFGYDDCVRGMDLLIVTEGAREVMKLWQEGYTNAVAILGSHLSDGHYKLISSLGPKKIALMFDGDKVGRAITEKVAERLQRLFHEDMIIKCVVPDGRDPKNLMRGDFDRLISH